MSDVTLRKAMIRLAAAKPHLREHLLPLLAEKGQQSKSAGSHDTLSQLKRYPYLEVKWIEKEGSYLLYFADQDFPERIWTEDDAALMKWLKQLETRAKKAQADLRKLTQKRK